MNDIQDSARRQVLAWLGTCLSGAAAAQPAGFPSRPVTIVVPYPPGGGTDVLARTLGEQLSLRLGQTVIVDNKPGASGNIGMAYGARAQPDGYTLTFLAAALVTNPYLFPSMPFEVSDFVPVTLLAQFASVLVVHPSTPYHSVRDVIEAAKAQPGKVFFSSAGNGSSGHLAAARLQQASGARLVNVPYKGDAPAMTAVLANEVSMSFSAPGGALPHIAAGRLRAIGVTSRQRQAKLPNVPAIAESVPGYESIGWFGVAGPKGMSRELATFYSRAIADAAAKPETMRKLQELNFDLQLMSPENFQTFIGSELAKYGKLIKELDIKL